MFISAFFANLMPSCLLLGIFAIFLQYITDKYLFLRKRNNRFNLGDELGNEMIEQLEYVLPIYAFSNLIFNYILYGGVDIMTILGLVIGVIHAALPMGEYNEIICKVFYILNYIRYLMLIVIKNYLPLFDILFQLIIVKKIQLLQIYNV